MTDKTIFETTESGEYLVNAPADGMEPDEVSVTLDGIEYRLHGYAGKDINSNVHADVLAYKYCTVIAE